MFLKKTRQNTPLWIGSLEVDKFCGMSTFSLNCAANSAAEAMISRYWKNFQQFFSLFDFDMKNSLLCLQFFLFFKQLRKYRQTKAQTDRRSVQGSTTIVKIFNFSLKIITHFCLSSVLIWLEYLNGNLTQVIIFTNLIKDFLYCHFKSYLTNLE